MTLALVADTLSFDLGAQLREGLTVEGQLSRADVAAMLNVTPSAVTRYLARSRDGEPYANDPFPPPDGRFGDRPYWRVERADEIASWAARQPRQGVGGPKRRS